MVKKIIVASALFMSQYSLAGVECLEKVTSVIIASNGVHFSTSGVCSDWCSINWANQDNVNRAYSALLTSVTTRKQVKMYWPNLASCSAKNLVWAVPDYVIINPDYPDN